MMWTASRREDLQLRWSAWGDRPCHTQQEQFRVVQGGLETSADTIEEDVRLWG